MIAGIPAGGVWGWPWHGLTTGGVIAGSGKTITQPPNGSAWLIDMDLPAITLTTAETASASANNYEWRNYALIAGGRIYDTALPENSFIHVDADDKCWLVRFTFSYTDENQVDISANIKRFGLFGYGELSSTLINESVTCEHIELTTALGNPISSHDSRVFNLQDVWTNGAKCLVGVFLNSTLPDSQTASDLYSVIEITITGSGGETGSGLSVSAAEIYGQSLLQARSATNGINEGLEHWREFNPSYGGHDLIQGWDYSSLYGRFAYYTSAGSAKYAALYIGGIIDHWETGYTDGTTICTDPDFVISDDFVTAEGVIKTEIVIYENTTVVDRLTSASYMSGTQRILIQQHLVDDADMFGATTGCSVYYLNAYSVHTNVEYTDEVWEGSLASNFDLSEADGLSLSVFNALGYAWRKSTQTEASAQVLIGSDYLGLQRLDAKCAALFHRNDGSTDRTYGTIGTPLGPLTYGGGSVTSDLYFAWQRKTGAYTFSISAICYV